MFVAGAFNFQYLDDWLIQAESDELCAQHTQRVLLLDGTGGESPEVRTDSFQTIPLSGIHVRHDKVSVFATTEEDGQISGDYSTYSQRPGGHSTSVAGLARPPGVFRESRSSGQTTHEGDYVLPVCAVGFQSHHVSPIHSLVSTGTQKSLLVDTATQCVQRMYDRASGTDDPFSYGCFSQGLGNTLGLPQHLGSLDSRGERRPHKHLGIGSGLQSVRHVATQVGGSGCPGRTGQLDSSCLLEQAGRHPITSTLSSGHTHSSSLRRPRHDIESATHSRGQERDCRRPVKKRGDCSR